MVSFFTKKWENCICSFVLGPFLGKNGGNLFSPIVRGGGRGRGLLNLRKFADPSGMTLLGVVTIEVHVRLGCLCQVFQFLGVSIYALDRISFRDGCSITTILIALFFVRELFLRIVFAFLWVHGFRL